MSYMRYWHNRQKVISVQLYLLVLFIFNAFRARVMGPNPNFINMGSCSLFYCGGSRHLDCYIILSCLKWYQQLVIMSSSSSSLIPDARHFAAMGVNEWS